MWAIGASRFKFTAAAASVGTGYLCFRLNEPEGSVRAAHMASGYKITSPNQTLPRIDATLPVKPIDKLIDCSNPGSCPDKLMTLKDIEDGCNEGRIIVGFKGGVYDMTNFTGHPGGYGRIEMAGGNDLEAFWSLYTQHNRGHVVEILKRYRIGSLSPADAETLRVNSKPLDNPYKNDPPPKKDLLTNTRYPYNAEGQLRQLAEEFVTPIGRHFVRNHGFLPDTDPETYALTVTGVGVTEREFSLAQLKAMPQVDVTTVIQCNGNRREDYHYLKEGVPAYGPPHWVCGAIGCATWSGVRLRDVLEASGMDVNAISTRKVKAPKQATNIGLLGADTDECGNQYCCSFPFEKAIDPYGDVILAYKMNGEDIPRQHGYPVRCIVPGNAGARNCKFVEKVTVTDDPCHDAGNWKQYSLHAMDVPLYKLQDFEIHHKELKADPPVQEMPVQSMICVPSAGDVLCCSTGAPPAPPAAAAADVSGYKNQPPSSSSDSNNSNTVVVDVKAFKPTVKVRGIAWGGGGEGVNRVDVSLDEGKTFTRADLEAKPAHIVERRKAEWSWSHFTAEVPLPDEHRESLLAGKPVKLTLVSKALNTSWNVQPEHAESNFNVHGCCVNHWYRVPVTVCPKASCDKKAPPGDFQNKPSGGAFRRPFLNRLPPSCPTPSC